VIEDYCAFFRKIEEDPLAPVTGITVGDFEKAKEHLHNCDDCNVRANRVVDRYSDRGLTIDISLN
jgi:hypothetical protein